MGWFSRSSTTITPATEDPQQETSSTSILKAPVDVPIGPTPVSATTKAPFKVEAAKAVAAVTSNESLESLKETVAKMAMAANTDDTDHTDNNTTTTPLASLETSETEAERKTKTGPELNEGSGLKPKKKAPEILDFDEYKTSDDVFDRFKVGDAINRLAA
ncbi:hypothetical protein BX616_003055, partial [Lobosporangium transversale]